MGEVDLEAMRRCRACLQKFKGHYSPDCSRCPTDAELGGKERFEIPGQTSMFDLLGKVVENGHH